MVFINKNQRTYQVKIEQTICSSSTAIVDLVLYGYEMNCCGMLVYVVRRLGVLNGRALPRDFGRRKCIDQRFLG